MHNRDCVDFVMWFCEQVKEIKPTHVGFLGDWFESRSAINIETLHYSYEALKLLDELNIPVLFVVGNHDLYRRTTRDVHSVGLFNELKNFTVVDKPMVIDGCLFSPFLFEHEYPNLAEHNALPAWFGHFEFSGFYITGYNTLLERGPSHKSFSGPKKIFSGHFHKRQANDNVVYIGNTFPMDFGDAGDNERGMAVYDLPNDKVEFKNWEACPKYVKINLDQVMEDKWKPSPKLKVKCIVNTDISYTDAQELRESLIKEHDLRDFILEEDRAVKQGLLESDTVKVDITGTDYANVDDLVVKQLEAAAEDTAFKDKYNVELLVDLYKGLKVESKVDE